ncbi:hypothetical protein NKJ74_06160, partial [Mesorhizobium sp. M0046]|uniref:hypothetical protein n=1 Tax=Mesorhizobium sp. M0046 TaxID=2956858 RepID=UPI0033363141
PDQTRYRSRFEGHPSKAPASTCSENSAYARSGYFTLVLSLLRPPPEATKEIVSAYWGWLEQTVLDPMKDNDPEGFEHVLRSTEATLAYVVDLNSKDISDEEQ